MEFSIRENNDFFEKIVTWDRKSDSLLWRQTEKNSVYATSSDYFTENQKKKKRKRPENECWQFRL